MIAFVFASVLISAYAVYGYIQGEAATPYAVRLARMVITLALLPLNLWLGLRAIMGMGWLAFHVAGAVASLQQQYRVMVQFLGAKCFLTSATSPACRQRKPPAAC